MDVNGCGRAVVYAVERVTQAVVGEDLAEVVWLTDWYSPIEWYLYIYIYIYIYSDRHTDITCRMDVYGCGRAVVYAVERVTQAVVGEDFAEVVWLTDWYSPIEWYLYIYIYIYIYI